MQVPTILLASSSPRRKQLFSWMGWNFALRAVDADEAPLDNEAPQAYVARLAESKAILAAPGLPQDWVVVAADTTVADGKEILGKPSDEEGARRILAQLRGRMHHVHTALVVLETTTGNEYNDLCTSRVPMRNYSDEEMEVYISSGDPLDKAGAYAIQNSNFHPVKNFHGCFANVMGLPLCHLTRTLAKLNIRPRTDVPRVCQENLNYDCPVYEAVLRGEKAG